MSNKEIGAELFIAAKTASVHVSNILAKLGAASRTEAAAIAHAAGRGAAAPGGAPERAEPATSLTTSRGAAVGLPRTSPDSVLFTTYNVLNLFQDDSAAGRERYRLVAESIRAAGPDVLAVQEIRAPGQATARARLRRLADDVGLRCGVPRPDGDRDQPALALGAHGYHCGLMWRDGIEPVPGSLRCHGAGYFWHSLASVTLDVGGVQVRHAAHHATPFGRRLRADQNETGRRPAGPPRGGPPTLVGADWNTECADRVRDEAPGTGSLRARRPLRRDRVVRRHDLPLRVGVRRARAAAALGRPGPGTCSGPAGCTTPRPRCARHGTPRSATIRTTRTASAGCGAASTASG